MIWLMTVKDWIFSHRGHRWDDAIVIKKCLRCGLVSFKDRI